MSRLEQKFARCDDEHHMLLPRDAEVAGSRAGRARLSCVTLGEPGEGHQTRPKVLHRGQ